MGLGGTADDSNTSLISDPLLPPLRQRLLNPHRITQIRFLSPRSLLSFLLFRRPNLLTLIYIDN